MSSAYEAYKTPEQVASELASGVLVSGNLKVNAKKRKVAYVTCKQFSTDIAINDETLRNRAFHGDEVVIELLPVEKWEPFVASDGESGGHGSEAVAVDVEDVQLELWQPQRFEFEGPGESSPHGGAAAVAMHPLNAVAKERQLQPAGKVVFILKANHPTSFTGTLNPFCSVTPGRPLPDSETKVIFRPMDPRYPHMMVNRFDLPQAFLRNPAAEQSNIYIADARPIWNQGSKMPFANNVRSIGEIGSIQAETTALLIENSVNHGEFQPEIMESLYRKLNFDGAGECSWTIPEEEIARRRDLRSYRIFTIDPPTAKDLDDALHITALEDGTFEIGCHIADVSYFVEEGSLLDAEAKERATSVYLVQKVIPMLPSILCEQLCSLNPNVDRLAFSCIWRMRADGTLIPGSAWYGKTVIRSCAKLDYYTA